MTTSLVSVLHIVDSLGLGGTQTILKDYLEGQDAGGSVHLYALRTVPKQIRIDHPHVVVDPSALRFSIEPLLALRRIVRERKIRVLHCHLFRAQVFGYLLKVMFYPGIALIFHEHGRAVGREGESRLEALAFRWFLRLAWSKVARFICVSEFTRSSLLRLIPRAESITTVVSNPIPVHPRTGDIPDRAALRRAAGIPDDAFVVGFASRLVERKGWRDFLDAVAILAPKIPVFFLLAGDGEDRAKVEAHIRNVGIEERGRMLGHIDWMPRFYVCLDCFAMPSHWEPHGLAHLEAQSFGVPIVISRVPGLASTVRGDDALLFEAGDVQGLADCIHRVAADKALRDRLAAGGVENAARYSRSHFSDDLEEIYATVEGRSEP